MSIDNRKGVYAKKLQDYRWIAKRREVLERDEFRCQSCGDAEGIMDVHHEYYLPNHEPWEYENKALITLCRGCHTIEERGRKEAYLALNRAIADAGFTKEDIIKMTWSFRGIQTLPHCSDMLTVAICRGIFTAFIEVNQPAIPIPEEFVY